MLEDNGAAGARATGVVSGADAGVGETVAVRVDAGVVVAVVRRVGVDIAGVGVTVA